MSATTNMLKLAVVAIALTTTIGLFYSSGSDSRLAPDDANQPQIELSEIVVDRATGNRTHNGAPFSGIAFQLHPNGQPKAQEEFLKGRRHGTLKKWFANGRMAFSSSYKSGRREGVTESWWSNGNKRSKTQYVNDRPDGEAWRWYRGGEDFKKYNYVAGVPVGLQRAWRLNGKLFSNFEIRNGRAYGLRNSNMCVELDNEEMSLGGIPVATDT